MTLPPHLQHRPFTANEALASGMRRAELTELVELQHLRRPFRGVYVDALVEDTVILRSQAASLVLQPHQVICDEAAMWLHGLPTMAPSPYDVGARLTVSALRGRQRSTRRETRGGERDLRPADIVQIGSVLVTSPARTCLDLACRQGAMRALATVDAYLHAALVTRAELLDLLARRYRGRRGVRQARVVVGMGSALSESSGESMTRMRIHLSGLPAPVPQFWVEYDGRLLFRLDLAWPAYGIVVEYDGEEFHGAERKAHDESRRDWLRRHGWHVIVVRKEHLSDEGCRAWIGELADVIAERSKPRGGHRLHFESLAPSRR